jgi:CTP synthase
LGHYERIAGTTVSCRNIYTSGTLYKELIEEQEAGKWLGETIQVIPHVTDKIQNRLEDLGKDSEIVIAEIGGTVGDVESGAFYEAISQFKQKHGSDVIIALVAPVLWVPTIKEYKTKPLQSAVRELQRHGIQPEMLFCRIDRTPLPDKILKKLSLFARIAAAITE